MGDTTPTQAALEQFEEVDSISAIDERDRRNDHAALVKVNDEEAIGDFFRIVRETGVERDATTRDDLNHTVLDSWINSPE